MTLSLDLSGPFFENDPVQTLFDNLRAKMEEISEQGADEARDRLSEGSTSRALVTELGDRVSDHVVGRTTSRSGKQWTAAVVVQVYNQGLTGRESRSLMAAASYVESRTKAISRTARTLRSLPELDLTDGLV